MLVDIGEQVFINPKDICSMAIKNEYTPFGGPELQGTCLVITLRNNSVWKRFGGNGYDLFAMRKELLAHHVQVNKDGL